MEPASKAHWEAIYRTRTPTEVSWFQPEARISRDLIQQIAPQHNTRILDVGGGASTLADGLLSDSYTDITVLDVSLAALEHARRRLGSDAALVHWLEGDVLTADLPGAGFDVWHDRAVFHFLTAPADRSRYVAQVRHAVRDGGHVLVATFAEDGPTTCSGLPVVRYAPEELHRELGSAFTLIQTRREPHVTPAGVAQSFVYCLFRFDRG